MARIAIVAFLLAAAPVRAAEPEWVAPMKAVHAKFTGTPGTLALFGDSITVSMAFWAPFEYAPKNLAGAIGKELKTVKGHMKAECWRKWRGGEYGNEGGKTILWASQNVGRWLKKLNPEAVVLMFGTNDLGPVNAREYEAATRQVVERCLKNGTVVLITTIPPRSGNLAKAKKYAAIQKKIASEYHLPVIDYQAEILKRRPKDWDGSLPQFKRFAKDVYQVPTLISADGVHPSFPKKHQDYTADSLDKNGFMLRNVLTLHAYAATIEKVLGAK